jgi:hypothetical protein
MNDARDIYKLIRELEAQHEDNDTVRLHDSFDLELNEHFVIETGVVDLLEDGVVLHLDEGALEFLDFNGMLNESEELDEKMVMGADSDASSAGSKVLGEGTSQAVADSIRHRILRQHHDLVAKYGPVRIMAAIEDCAAGKDDLEEIGSSDVSIWTRQVIDDLEKGYYDDVDAEFAPVKRDVTEGAVEDFKSKLSRSNDPFEMVYNALSGDFGEGIRIAMQEMYDDVVIDNHGRLHPDDDFEKIIDIIVDQLVDEGGHELEEIKKLALGHREDDLEEGWKSWALGGAALLAAILGGNEMAYQHALKTDPQLSKLVSYLELAQKRHDADKVKELKDRIKQTYDHLAVTGGEVMGDDGKPVDPVYEAEYQGRKVPLGKPMKGDVKKSKVYVRKPNGKVVKVNFGDKNMRIKKSSPSHRKSFRARHHCENPGPRWKARYWSCRAW